MLRAKSVYNVGAPPREEKAKKIKDLDINQLDCGCCKLTFESTCHGTYQLKIRAQAGKQATDIRKFQTAVESIIKLEAEFVILVDIRDVTPGKSLENCFSSVPRESWVTYRRSAALIVAENIFDVAAKGRIGDFIQKSLPGCQTLLCHDESIAVEFFGSFASLGDASSLFVSMTEILASPSTSNLKESASTSSLGSPTPSKPNRKNSLVASLMPSFPRVASTSRMPQISSIMHQMPNGDTRVTQTMPNEFEMRKRSLTGSLMTPPSIKGSTGNLQALAAVKFKCSKMRLDRLLGVYFHIGELAADFETKDHHSLDLDMNGSPSAMAAKTEKPKRANCFKGVIRCICGD